MKTQIDILDSYRFANFGNKLLSLLSLDTVWTRQLEFTPKPESYPIKPLNMIGEEMLSLMHKCIGEAQWAISTSEKYSNELDALFSSSISKIDIDSTLKLQFSEIIGKSGGLQNYFRISMTKISECLRYEQQILQTKLDELNKNGICEGDMGHRAECAVITGAALVCALVAFGPGVGGCLGAFFSRGCLSQ
jgi:hypothetical protein